MTLQHFIFELPDGTVVGECTVHEVLEENLATRTLIVVGGKRFEIIGHRAPTLARDKDAWARILIVWPYTA